MSDTFDCLIDLTACGQCQSVNLLTTAPLAACALLAGFQDQASCEAANASFAHCNNECVDTTNDERHCGGCWLACDEGKRCEAATCT